MLKKIGEEKKTCMIEFISMIIQWFHGEKVLYY